MISNNKKNDKPKNSSITKEVMKYWFIDEQVNKIKRVKEYSGKSKLISFDHDAHTITDEDGKSFKVYNVFKEAGIVLLHNEIENKRQKWKFHVDESMKQNEEICDLLDKLNKLRDMDY